MVKNPGVFLSARRIPPEQWLRRPERARIALRLLLLKLLLGDTSGLQDRACSLFHLAAPK
jgi:hypothetical protein